MAWPKKDILTIELPLFNHQVVHVFRTRKAYEKALKHLKVDNNLGGCNGHSWWLENDEYGQMFIAGIFNKDLSTLVHELEHVTFYIFEHLGIKAGCEDPEIHCYTIQHLFRESREFIENGKDS